MRVWCGSSQVKSITDRCSTIGANPTSQGGLVDWRCRKFRHSRENRMSFSKGPGPPRTDTRLNDCMIIGVRLSLVWAGSRQSTLAAHLGRLISHAAAAGCLGVLHISSVAVADHVVSQHNVSESAPLPALDAYHSDYDRFKRLSEVIVDDECTKANERSAMSGETRMMVWTHLRISGIFSNDPACIQCTAVRNQAYISAYSSTCIDFNSSANVSHAIILLVERIVRVVTALPVSADPSVPVECAADPHGRRVQRVYYYTRATTAPVPYGALVADYRYSIQYALLIASDGV